MVVVTWSAEQTTGNAAGISTTLEEWDMGAGIILVRRPILGVKCDFLMGLR